MGEREFSCIKQVVNTVQIPLPATFITNEIAGIAEILESWKRQYKKQLQGVVVNYRHYSLSSSSGFIAPNKPFVYYNVTATFDLFCPKVGDIVKGKINRISNEHIGCLIEDTINVTIHLSKNSNDESLSFINLNREILFEITYFSYDRKEIRVKGKITPRCIQLMKDLFPPVTFNNIVDAPELSNNTDEGIGTSSECTDDGLLNHVFDDSEFNDESFKKPFSSNTDPKKKALKRLKNDSESSSMDTSDISGSYEKPKKKKKHKDKPDPKMGNDTIGNNLLSDPITCNAVIENFSNFNHDDILGAIKEEELPIEDAAIIKKHKKKRNKNSSPDEDTTSSVLDTSVETVKVSKKRKRESESSYMDTSEQSTADEMPKKKKKCKDKTVLPSRKKIEQELLNMSVDDAEVLSIKEEILSPVEAKNNSFPEGKKKKKNKDKKVKDKKKEKKSKDKDKPKKKKGKVLASGAVLKKDKDKPKKKKVKVLASGAVLKKDKKAHKKASKKNKLDGEKSKKHKKDKSEKKKKGKSKSKVPDVIKSDRD